MIRCLIRVETWDSHLLSWSPSDRLSKIEHKDGAVVKESFAYVLDDNGNITRTTESDGAYWDYGYDGRDRLTLAERKNSGATITAAYAYAYDDADNMLTKVEPFADNFNDTNYTGWTAYGPWSASTGQMVNTADVGWSTYERSVSDASFEVSFDYVNKNTSVSNYRLMVDLRITSGGERLMLAFHPTDARLAKYVGGVWSFVDQEMSATTTQDQLYHVRVVCDGSSVTVWRWRDGEMPIEILRVHRKIARRNTVTPSRSPIHSVPTFPKLHPLRL